MNASGNLTSLTFDDDDVDDDVHLFNLFFCCCSISCTTYCHLSPHYHHCMNQSWVSNHGSVGNDPDNG